MLEIDQFDPKRHPKSLVSILSTCRTKYSVYTIYQLFAEVMHFLNVLLPPQISSSWNMNLISYVYMFSQQIHLSVILENILPTKELEFQIGNKSFLSFRSEKGKGMVCNFTAPKWIFSIFPCARLLFEWRQYWSYTNKV